MSGGKEWAREAAKKIADRPFRADTPDGPNRAAPSGERPWQAWFNGDVLRGESGVVRRFKTQAAAQLAIDNARHRGEGETMTSRSYEKKTARLVQEATKRSYVAALNLVRKHQELYPEPMTKEARALAILEEVENAVSTPSSPPRTHLHGGREGWRKLKSYFERQIETTRQTVSTEVVPPQPNHSEKSLRAIVDSFKIVGERPIHCSNCGALSDMCRGFAGCFNADKAPALKKAFNEDVNKNTGMFSASIEPLVALEFPPPMIHYKIAFVFEEDEVPDRTAYIMRLGDRGLITANISDRQWRFTPRGLAWFAGQIQ